MYESYNSYNLKKKETRFSVYQTASVGTVSRALLGNFEALSPESKKSFTFLDKNEEISLIYEVRETRFVLSYSK